MAATLCYCIGRVLYWTCWTVSALCSTSCTILWCSHGAVARPAASRWWATDHCLAEVLHRSWFTALSWTIWGGPLDITYQPLGLLPGIRRWGLVLTRQGEQSLGLVTAHYKEKGLVVVVGCESRLPLLPSWEFWGPLYNGIGLEILST